MNWVAIRRPTRCCSKACAGPSDVRFYLVMRGSLSLLFRFKVQPSMHKRIQKPRSAYFLFLTEERDKLKQEFPELGFVDLAKKTGERWLSLSDEQKAVWLRKADDEKRLYEQAVRDAESGPQPQEPKKAAARVKKAEDVPPPKRPLSAFMFFANEQRPSLARQNPQLSVIDISKSIAERWKDLPEPNRVTYVNQAAEAKEQYERELAAYEQRLPTPKAVPETKKKAANTARSKKSQQANPVAMGQPRKPKSAFLFFFQEQRPLLQQESPQLSLTDVTRTIGDRWNALDASSLRKYQVMAEEARAQYDREMQTYNNAVAEGSTIDVVPRAKETRRQKTLYADPEASATKSTNTATWHEFCKEMRPRLKEQFPGCPAAEINKKLSELWNHRQ